MKATIKYTDGKTIDLEGTYDEVCGALMKFGIGVAPISIPTVFGNGCSHEYDMTSIFPLCKKCGYALPTFTYGTVEIYCAHEYPSPWMATIPPSCKKCGQQAAYGGFTCSSVTIS